MKSYFPDLIRKLAASGPFRPASPPLAVEIAEDHLVMVRLARSGARTELAGFFVGELPPGAVRGSGAQPNITDSEAVRKVLRAARQKVAPAGGPVALCLPDQIVRLAVIATDAIPRGEDQVRELIAWRIKKTLPYRIEEAQIDWQAFTLPDGKHSLLAAAVRRRVLSEYEILLESEGFEVGTVAVSTLALAEHLPEGSGDALLINVGAGWFSMAISDGREPVFFRSKLLPENERRGPERDWYVAGEITPTLEYYRTRMARPGLRRVFLQAPGAGRAALEATLGTVLDIPIEALRVVPPTALPLEAAQKLAPACAVAARAFAGAGARVAAPASPSPVRAGAAS